MKPLPVFPLILSLVLMPLFITAQEELPKTSLGMNIGGGTYWNDEDIFVNMMWASENWRYFNADGSKYTAEEKAIKGEIAAAIAVDSNGYPLEIPAKVEGHKEQAAGLYISGSYPHGQYVLLYDGEGELDFWERDMKVDSVQPGRVVFTLEGDGFWRVILQKSVKGNHIRNMRILPYGQEDYDYMAKPYRQFYLDFLKPFQCLRYMPMQNTNGGNDLRHWKDRVLPTNYSQRKYGVALEHMITLANQTKTDAWFCMPHLASDDFMLQFAEMVKRKLDPDLKFYVEFSNELWNWGQPYPQSHWVANNGRWDRYPEWDAPDSIHNKLRDIGQEYCGGPEKYCHPQKDAYMMARMFNIFRSVFTGADRDRLVCVAGLQQFYNSTTTRILKYLFDEGNGGCDAISPTSYYQLPRGAREEFDSRDSGDVTVDEFLDSVEAKLDFEFGPEGRALELKQLADEYNVDIVNYEGGSHVYDYKDHHWNDVRAAAARNPRVYDIYIKNIRYWDEVMESKVNVHLSSQGDLTRFAHVETWDQIYLPLEEMKIKAPKYAALIATSNRYNSSIIKAFNANGKQNSAQVLKTFKGQLLYSPPEQLNHWHDIQGKREVLILP